jgi:hypothetical protein
MRNARSNASGRSREPLVYKTCSLMQRWVSDARARLTMGVSGSPPVVVPLIPTGLCLDREK